MYSLLWLRTQLWTSDKCCSFQTLYLAGIDLLVSHLASALLRSLFLQPARPQGSEGALVTKTGAEPSLEKAVKCQISTFKAQTRADFPRAAALPQPKSQVPWSLAAWLEGSSFGDELFLNNFSTVCDTDRLFFDTRRACLLAPAISFLDKHMYCSQCKENPAHIYVWVPCVPLTISQCTPGTRASWSRSSTVFLDSPLVT